MYNSHRFFLILLAFDAYIQNLSILNRLYLCAFLFLYHTLRCCAGITHTTTTGYSVTTTTGIPNFRNPPLLG
ncbi:hypothetical protein BDZ91DRAFT_725354 [Kalaharituber pfeilii]|nr:hypothetical protein BDZ91DRAFT_725354 [Kalaharituber pfeilii]